MAKRRFSFWQIILEFISVVFAVLLALGLNSYKQSIDLKEESKVLKQKIIEECNSNLTELDSTLRENAEYLRYLDSLRRVEVITALNLNFTSELLTNSAWTYTQTSPAYTYLDNEFLNSTIRVYEMQAFYMTSSKQMVQNMGEIVMNSDNIKTRTIVNTSHYYLTNIQDSGDQLRQQYQELLSSYDSIQ